MPRGGGETQALERAPRRRGAVARKRHDPLGRTIRSVLTEDLLKPEYRGAERPYTGHCYVATEAYYHLKGGKNAGYQPMGIEHEGSQHWWLAGPDGKVIDLTAEQFETPVPYELGKRRGFLTRDPSKRAKTVIERVRAAAPELAPPLRRQPLSLPARRKKLEALYSEIAQAYAHDPEQVPRKLVPAALEADTMVIGQALGRDTQRLSGLPWVFPDGKLSGGGRTLDRFLSKFGRTVEPETDAGYVYCSDIAHHFPGRREDGHWDKLPEQEEVERSRAWLETELETVQPKVVVLLGKEAALTFLSRYGGVEAKKLGDLLGKPHRCTVGGHELTAYAVHHPSAAWQFPQSGAIYEQTAKKIARELRG